MKFFEKVPSGSDGFDRAVDSIRIGDNVVWQIDDIEGYSALALSFALMMASRTGFQVLGSAFTTAYTMTGFEVAPVAP